MRARSRSAPQALVAKRISDLHRRLISPVSDLETVKAAKHSLLRLLADPMMLPVLTTPPMEFAAPTRNAAATPSQSEDATPGCEVCRSPLPPRSSARPERSLISTNGLRGLRSKPRSSGKGRLLAARRAISPPFFPTAHAFS